MFKNGQRVQVVSADHRNGWTGEVAVFPGSAGTCYTVMFDNGESADYPATELRAELRVGQRFTIPAYMPDCVAELVEVLPDGRLVLDDVDHPGTRFIEEPTVPGLKPAPHIN